jgi:hypothetical protein
MPSLEALFGQLGNMGGEANPDMNGFPDPNGMGSPEPSQDAGAEGRHGRKYGKKGENKKRRNIGLYCTDLTARARNNELDNIIGRQREIDRAIQILCRRSKNNPCLIGEPGVGKTAIAEGLAERIAKAYHGSDFAGTYPTENDFNISYIVEYEKDWAELFLYGNYNSVSALKLTEYKGLRIEMDDNYGSKLQVKVYGDATGSSFKEAYYTLSANSKTTTVNFENAKTGSTVSRITLQTNVGATKAKINQVALIKSDNSEVKLSPTTAWGCTLSTESTPVSGIHELHYTPQTDNRIYNLQGQQIAQPRRGIYIQNGKKFIAK